MNLTDLASLATVIALVISLISIAFSSRRYIALRQAEMHRVRFETYHGLVKAISLGSEAGISLKLVSQIAYIYELRNFPEYSSLTKTVLSRLRTEWAENSVGSPNNKPLSEAMDSTIAHLEAVGKI